MYQIISTLTSLRSDKRAVTALEYGLIAAVIAGVLATLFTGIGTHLNTLRTGVNNNL
jgi:pilus assembly protein Flp/PilA